MSNVFVFILILLAGCSGASFENEADTIWCVGACIHRTEAHNKIEDKPIEEVVEDGT